ncbi:hypothetical protein NMY22_g14158 [Coprinellus aureogranulatus]|nr:hypothetical protein NMY22_g14158 [Coprinellus aureogranulatus]
MDKESSEVKYTGEVVLLDLLLGVVEGVVRYQEALSSDFLDVGLDVVGGVKPGSVDLLDLLLNVVDGVVGNREALTSWTLVLMLEQGVVVLLDLGLDVIGRVEAILRNRTHLVPYLDLETLGHRGNGVDERSRDALLAKRDWVLATKRCPSRLGLIKRIGQSWDGALSWVSFSTSPMVSPTGCSWGDSKRKGRKEHADEDTAVRNEGCFTSQTTRLDVVGSAESRDAHSPRFAGA